MLADNRPALWQRKNARHGLYGIPGLGKQMFPNNICLIELLTIIYRKQADYYQIY